MHTARKLHAAAYSLLSSLPFSVAINISISLILGEPVFDVWLSVEACADRNCDTMCDNSLGWRDDYSVEFFVCGLYSAGVSAWHRGADASYRLNSPAFPAGGKEQRACKEKDKDIVQNIPYVKDRFAKDVIAHCITIPIGTSFHR